MVNEGIETDKENEESAQEFTPKHDHRSSIDLSLELERELDALEVSASDPVSLDPQVLSSLVSQLRHSIAELTQTRDDLISSLTQSKTENAERQHNLVLANEREKVLQKKIDELDEQTRADRATINLLRQNVEESRRGLMRLQTEHRRSSSVVQPLTLDLSKPGATAKSSGRSLTLIGGNGSFLSRPSSTKGHRRFSSIAGTTGQEFNFTSPEEFSYDPTIDQASSRPSRNSNRLSHLRETTGLVPPHTAPLANQDPVSIKEYKEQNDINGRLFAAQKEIESLKERLTEAEEAKEASEVCVKALREFIEHHRIGEDESTQPTQPVVEKKNSSGWSGIKLWRTDPNFKSNDDIPCKAPSIASHRSSSSSSPNPAAVPFIPQSPTPLKGLFGLNFLSPSRPSNSQQDAMFNGSDTSSEGRRSMSPPSQLSALAENANVLENRV